MHAAWHNTEDWPAANISLLQAQNPESKPKIPSFDEELDIFLANSKTNKANHLDRPHRKRTQTTFSFKAGVPLDADILKTAIDRLRSLGYTDPIPLNPSIVEKFVAQVMHDADHIYILIISN